MMRRSLRFRVALTLTFLAVAHPTVTRVAAGEPVIAYDLQPIPDRHTAFLETTLENAEMLTRHPSLSDYKGERFDEFCALTARARQAFDEKRYAAAWADLSHTRYFGDVAPLKVFRKGATRFVYNDFHKWVFTTENKTLFSGMYVKTTAIDRKTDKLINYDTSQPKWNPGVRSVVRGPERDTVTFGSELRTHRFPCDITAALARNRLTWDFDVTVDFPARSRPMGRRGEREWPWVAVAFFGPGDLLWGVPVETESLAGKVERRALPTYGSEEMVGTAFANIKRLTFHTALGNVTIRVGTAPETKGYVGLKAYVWPRDAGQWHFRLNLTPEKPQQTSTRFRFQMICEVEPASMNSRTTNKNR